MIVLEHTGQVRSVGEGFATAVLRHGLSIRAEIKLSRSFAFDDIAKAIEESGAVFEPWVLAASHRLAIAYFSTERDRVVFLMLVPPEYCQE
jgi:hypothetical protein